jgi:hypothetical protein
MLELMCLDCKTGDFGLFLFFSFPFSEDVLLVVQEQSKFFEISCGFFRRSLLFLLEVRRYKGI